MGTDTIHSSRAFEIHGRGVYLAALALTLLAMAACGAQARGRASAAAPTATATATPMPRLPFRPVALPPGFDTNPGSIAASPVDGKDAWACLSSGNGSFKIWATTDEGSTWHAAGQLHPMTPQPVNRCGVVADQHDPQVAVFTVEWGSVQNCNQALMSFYTRDGGAHWRQLPGWTGIASVVTDGDTTYALMFIFTLTSGQPQPALLESISPPRLSAPGPCPTQQTQEHSVFVVSSDGLDTWRELHPGDLRSGNGVYQLWYGPTSGELFAATNNGGLWHSLNGGASWTPVSAPGGQVTLGRWLASRKAWAFCGPAQCSMDTGNTWQQTPNLTVTIHVPCDAWCHQKGGADSQTLTCQTFALGADGSVLATCPLDRTTSAPAQFMAYRFAPGTTAWAAVGQVPAQSCSVSANSIMWCPDAGGWETVALPA